MGWWGGVQAPWLNLTTYQDLKDAKKGEHFKDNLQGHASWGCLFLVMRLRVSRDNTMGSHMLGFV